MSQETKNIFPKWMNALPAILLVVLSIGGITAVFVVTYWFSPKHTDVGYAPKQPVDYSHRLHAGELGIDCRYCHVNVERNAQATVPPTSICMNCHSTVKTDSEKLIKVRESFATGKPIEWVKVHNLPDYVYFDHSRHVNSGVSCVECHGRVDQMDVVHQVKPLSMSWCLECHRDPAPRLRPQEFITQMDWSASDRRTLGEKIMKEKNIDPKEDCSTCHR